MKIGIITHWWSNDNYGQQLQCFALQRYLRNLGNDVFLIRYYRNKDIISSTLLTKVIHFINPKQLIKYINCKLNQLKIKKEVLEHNRKFNEFRQKYIKMSDVEYFHYTELVENPPEADMYIVGSDQVWNSLNLPLKRFKNPLHAYFLDFGSPETKRCSYAASKMILKKKSEEYIEEIKPMLSKFNYVSVREKELLSFCSECGYDNAEWVCDPTLLLSAEQYRELYKDNEIQKPNKRYLLLYMLANKNEFDISLIYNFAAKKQLEVIYITGNGVVDKREKFFATIPEWLYLIDNAEYVITNSYHCGIFSSIFHKKFAIIPLSGRHSAMNARFENLFEMLGVEKRYLKQNDFSVLDNDYEVIDVEIPRAFLELVNN